MSQHEDDPAAAREPLALLERAAVEAASDSGAGHVLLERADTVAIVEIVTWHYPDAGASLARRLGIEPHTTVVTTTGGNSPQMLLNELCDRVVSGDTDVALMGGAECMRTRRRARQEPRTWLEWTKDTDPPCGDVIGVDRDGASDAEQAAGLNRPLVVYPLFDTAQRHAAGRSVDEHRVATGALYAGFSDVAASNPHAWSQVAFTPDDIATPGDDNRMIVAPYPLRMCANEAVDMAAALIVCSYEVAVAAGIAADRMVFPLSGSDGTDVWNVTERPSLAVSPGLAATAHAALGALGIDAGAVSRFDLYSCFPSAVHAAMDALALGGPAGGDGRPLTVTGGLSFAGGPMSNYVTHSIASMVDACRQDPGSIGMTTALGWYLTKHAAGLYSSAPPTGGWRRTSADDGHLARTRAFVPPDDLDGAAELTIEATAVVMTRDGSPEHALVSALTDGGVRTVARTERADTCTSMVDETWEGRRIRVCDLR
ncbi:MAG: hypothetical protein M5U31_08335 [Acidimicrobiia bacterium]|nr:hypothetical protein [Acidimicrobiia bacterium]